MEERASTCLKTNLSRIVVLVNILKNKISYCLLHAWLDGCKVIFDDDEFLVFISFCIIGNGLSNYIGQQRSC